MKRNILEAAKVIRSKNAGPFELTYDIMFKNREFFEQFKNQQIINRKMIAGVLKISESDILSLIWFAPANAVKITIKRPMPSGAPGETDIYGAQQHAPLLAIEF
ncbi:MAG: acyl-CoA synthetase [Candidatus Riflebacteria bacterium GWC2_50_8]|nr:MAG: acyl-CoA synthetase [Candidatus Riflebacteria bacterium GWC2_50_8]